MINKLYTTTALAAVMLMPITPVHADTVTITDTAELTDYLLTQTDYIQNVIVDATTPFQMTDGHIKASELNISSGTFKMLGNTSSAGSQNNLIISAGAELDMEVKSLLHSSYQEDELLSPSKIDVSGLVDMDGSGIRAESSADGKSHAVVNIKSGGRIFAEGTDDFIASRETNIESGGTLEVKANTIFDIVGDAVTSADGDVVIDDSAKMNEGVLSVAENGTILTDGTFNTNAISLNNNGKIVNGEAGILNITSNYQSSRGVIENAGTVNLSSNAELNNATIRNGVNSAGEDVFGKLTLTKSNLTLTDNSKIISDTIEITGSDMPPSADETYTLTIDNTSSLQSQNGITLKNTLVELNGGRIEGDVLAEGTTININEETSYIHNLQSAANLNINSDTSVTQLIGRKSEVENMTVGANSRLTLDTIGGIEPINLTICDTLNIEGTVVVDATNEISAIEANTIVNTQISGGTLDVGYNKFHSSVTFDEVKGGTLNIGVKNGTEQNNQAINGKVGNLTGTTAGKNAHVNLIFADTYKIARKDIEEIKITEGSMNKQVLLNNNPLYNYYSDIAGTQLTDNLLTTSSVFIKRKSNKEIVENLVLGGLSLNDSNVITGFADGENINTVAQDVANVMTDLVQSGNMRAAGDLANQVAPETAPIIQSQITDVTAQIYNAVSKRLASNPRGGYYSSGDEYGYHGALWLQGLMSKNKLDKHDGFKSDSDGFALGYERYLSGNNKVGIGYAYTDSDIKSYAHKDDVDTYTAFIYGEYKPSNWYVNAVATYNWGEYTESKYRETRGKFDVNSFSLQTMSGYDIIWGQTIITPEAGLRYIHANRQAYRDSLSQYVKSDDMDYVTGIAGLKLQQIYVLSNDMYLKPELKMQVTYDLQTSDNGATVLLSNGSGYQVYGEALDKLGMELGAEITADYRDNMEFTLGYNYRMREKYEDHTGLLQAKYKF